MNQLLHQPTASLVGVMLVNLGTPDSANQSDVRRYLKEFLSDSRVVHLSRLLWWPVLNLIILNTRPKKTAKAYQKVWTDQGSPLMVHSEQQLKALQVKLDPKEKKYKVVLAMRYGKPSVLSAMQAFQTLGVHRIVVLPLYPQFSYTTTAAVEDAVKDAEKNINTQFSDSLQWAMISHYHHHPAYIQALAVSISDYWSEHGRAEHLVFSFHGIPENYISSGDPYANECHETITLLVDALQLLPEQYTVSFQSRMGAKKWLQPYTDMTLVKLAQNGVKNLQIVCPGFSADCLETLEEIQMENRDVFLQAGGKQYQYIPCLNARDEHISMMADLVRGHHK